MVRLCLQILRLYQSIISLHFPKTVFRSIGYLQVFKFISVKIKYVPIICTTWSSPIGKGIAIVQIIDYCSGWYLNLCNVNRIYLCYVCKKLACMEIDRQRHGPTPSAELVEFSRQSNSEPSADNRVTSTRSSALQSSSPAPEIEKQKILKTTPTKTTPAADDATRLELNPSTGAQRIHS